jgi:hypothetical protein
LSNILWGFASAQFFDESFYQQAAIAALSKDLSAQHLANILWAFSRVRPRHQLTQCTILRFLPRCCHQIWSFKAQEVSSIALSVAKAFMGDEPNQQVALPAEVIDFFGCLPTAVPRDMADFSNQSLINMASAFTMVGFCDEEGMLPVLGQEAIYRADNMESVDLLRLFQVFLSARSPSTSSAAVAGHLALKLADRLKSLRARDVRSLSRSYTEFFDLKQGRDLSRQEIRECCLQVARTLGMSEVSVPMPKMAWTRQDPSYNGDLNLELISAADTEEPSGRLSDISDNIEEDVDSCRISSDTEFMLTQQVQTYDFELYQDPRSSFFHLPDEQQYYHQMIDSSPPSSPMNCYNWMMQPQPSWSSASSPSSGPNGPHPDGVDMWGLYVQADVLHANVDDSGYNTDDGF